MPTKRIEARIEKDALGQIQLPINCYWGAKTARAKEQLFSCGWRLPAKLLQAVILIKKAVASVNVEFGQFEARIGTAIAQVCDEVLAGQWQDQFIAELFQSGVGITINANVNEVLANRAEELLGGSVGEYKIVDPDDHVNHGQSNDDVFATATSLSVLAALTELEPVLLDLERLLRRKALEFAKIVKANKRYHSEMLSFGQELNALGSTIERCLKHIKDSANGLLEINLPLTWATASSEMRWQAANRLSEKLSMLTHLKLRLSEDLLRTAQPTADFICVSSSLRELAIELELITSRQGLIKDGLEAVLPNRNMPADELGEMLSCQTFDQIQPSVIESLNMVCSQVIGNDLATMLASRAGQRYGKAMTPAMVHNLLQSLALLRLGVAALNQRCLA